MEVSRLKFTQSGAPVRQVVLIKDYAILKTKGGKDYIAGQVQSGEVMSFKAWGQSLAFSKLKEYDYKLVPALIVGSFDDYGGVASIVIDDINAVEDCDIGQFLEVKYDKEGYYSAIVNYCMSNLSDNGKIIANKVLFDNEPVRERFKVEFAASSHHDNCLSGLMAHTFKLLSLMSWVIQTYPQITKGDQSKKDLLIIGTLLHDIGKIDEMHYGVYQPLSAVTHRILGLDYINPLKEEIIRLYDEKWFRDLQSIIVEHHGEFGDPCRTVVSYVVHLVDCFESQCMLLNQSIEGVSEDSINPVIKQQDFMLAL